MDLPTTLEIPTIPEADRGPDPPLCLHGRATTRRTVMRSPLNLGRAFYVCSSGTSARCAFFRWADEVGQYSVVRSRPLLTAAEVHRATAAVDPDEQLEAWDAVQQGTDRWHRLRACRVTASNFGSAHRTNTYCSPNDLLRNLLWPSNMDSVAMRYGSVNET
jgi:hypothetical protein